MCIVYYSGNCDSLLSPHCHGWGRGGRLLKMVSLPFIIYSVRFRSRMTTCGVQTKISPPLWEWCHTGGEQSSRTASPTHDGRGITGSAVVVYRVNSDTSSEWKRSNFDPSTELKLLKRLPKNWLRRADPTWQMGEI